MTECQRDCLSSFCSGKDLLLEKERVVRTEEQQKLEIYAEMKCHLEPSGNPSEVSPKELAKSLWVTVSMFEESCKGCVLNIFDLAHHMIVCVMIKLDYRNMQG